MSPASKADLSSPQGLMSIASMTSLGKTSNATAHNHNFKVARRLNGSQQRITPPEREVRKIAADPSEGLTAPA
jgi:hypothetical protein